MRRWERLRREYFLQINTSSRVAMKTEMKAMKTVSVAVLLVPKSWLWTGLFPDGLCENEWQVNSLVQGLELWWGKKRPKYYSYFFRNSWLHLCWVRLIFLKRCHEKLSCRNPIFGEEVRKNLTQQIFPTHKIIIFLTVTERKFIVWNYMFS